MTEWSNCSKAYGFSCKSRTKQCIAGCMKLGNNTKQTEWDMCDVNDLPVYGK